MGTITGQTQKADYSETMHRIALNSPSGALITRVVLESAKGRTVSAPDFAPAIAALSPAIRPQHLGAVLHVMLKARVLQLIQGANVKAVSATNEHHDVITYRVLVRSVEDAQAIMQRHLDKWAADAEKRAVAAEKRSTEAKRLRAIESWIDAAETPDRVPAYEAREAMADADFVYDPSEA